MEQPREQSEQGSRPAQRDMVYCHECSDEWYRDQHGLVCPECHSDFTEIIEQENDPRDFTHDEAGDGDDDHSMRSSDNGQLQFNTHLNPWVNEDPDEEDISRVHLTRVGPTQFNIHATITRSMPPGAINGTFGPGAIGTFMSMLNGLAGQPPAHIEQQRDQNSEQVGQQNEDGQQNERGRQTNLQSDIPGVRSSRFTYHGGIRLGPRDPNHPEPRIGPVEDIAEVLANLMGSPTGLPHHLLHDPEQPRGNQIGQEMPPILQLFASLGLLPGERFGDAVYSQEALDQIISQLMEQTATSNAPGPASQNDIETLPRLRVNEEMLGPEGRAECSICMDEVNIGEEVTELPCKHWFHHQCVAAWLGEHDTCPHCRKGITKKNETEEGNSSGEQAASGAEASRPMPGIITNNGSSHTVPSNFRTTNPQNNPQNGNNEEGSAQDNGHGLGGRLRRGLFGP